MKSFMGKVVTVVAGIMMVGSVAFADSATINENALQTQSDISNIYSNSGWSLGGGVQSSHIDGVSVGTGYGTANTYQAQDDSYNESSGTWGNYLSNSNGTNHNGLSVMTSNSTLDLDGEDKGNVNADQAQGSITLTGNSGPSNMDSFMLQRTHQKIDGSVIEQGNISTDLYSRQTDKYTQAASDGSGWAYHTGIATQTAALKGNSVRCGELEASNTAIQYGKTSTEYSVGGVNSMSSDQFAVSMDYNNGSSYDNASYNANVGQEQTHDFEQYSANGSDGSWQYSSGSVTTGTGSLLYP